MGKHSKEKDTEAKEVEVADPERPEYEELVTRVSEIAKPLAGKKLTKRVYRTVKKGKLC